MKKQVLLLLAALVFSQAAYAYVRSAVAPSGQTLYYYLSESNSPEVYVINPGWSDFEEPTGDLIIPDSVTFGLGMTHSVVCIYDEAFKWCTGLTTPNTYW